MNRFNITIPAASALILDTRSSFSSPLNVKRSTLHSRRLNPVESALAQNTPATLSESALPNSLDLKSFGINTYEKRGEGYRQQRTSKLHLRPTKRRHQKPTHGLQRRQNFPCFITSLLHFVPSINSVHGDAAHQLREKVRGLLRHHLPTGGDLHYLFHVAGIQEERNLRPATVHRIESSRGFAD